MVLEYFIKMQANSNKQYYYWLDWLRWLSALIVVLDHCRFWVFKPFGELAPTSQGIFSKIFYSAVLMSNEAVLVFFILSGFLVGGKTTESLVNRKTINVKSFFVNRMTRIWLPLAFALGLTAISQLIMGQRIDIVRMFGNFLCLNGTMGIQSELAILWTMPYIVWFYMLLASLIMICDKDNGNTQVCLGVVLMGITLAVATALTTKLFIVVGFGALAFFLSKIRLPKAFFCFSLGFAISLIVLTKLVRPSNAIDQSGWISYFDLDTLKLIEGIVFAVLISQIVNATPSGKMLKIEQGAKQLAKFSYSMYLTHLIVVNLLVWAGLPQYDSFSFESIVVYLSLVLLCVLFGYISYLLVEKHTVKLKKLFFDRVACVF